MLEYRKQITITAESLVDEQIVMTMNATITRDGSGAYQNKNVVNDKLYNENRMKVRADAARFDGIVYIEEDRLKKEFEDEQEDKETEEEIGEMQTAITEIVELEEIKEK